MNVRIGLLLALLVLSACASQSPMRDLAPAVVPLGKRSSDRLIIAAVDSRPSAFLGRAGSSPRGYDAVTTYGPSSAAMKAMHDLEKQYALREVTAWPIAPLNMHCAVLEVPAGTDPANLLASLAQDARIKLAEPLQTFATRSEHYNDPYVSLQHGFMAMDVADAHSWSRGEDVRVAIIDTGVDTQHPDLRGSVVAIDNFVDTDERQFRLDRHGTEVAGVIAAAANNGVGIVGVAPAARLLVYKACWQVAVDADAARCNSFTLARALVAAYDAKAQVVNLSIGGPPDRLLSSLIAVGLRRGIVFVGAAPSELSNGGALMQQDGVIAVAMAGSTAPLPALYAPGREILTLLPGGRFDFASGTSIATAQVTGVVALLLARNKDMTASAVLQLLTDTSSHGHGTDVASVRVDACAAVTAMVRHGECLPLDARETAATVNTTQRLALH